MNAKKIQRELLQPFSEQDLEWRVQQAGISRAGKPYAMIIAYVTSRAVQTRLDEVVGAFNWTPEFKSLPNSVGDGALCGISILFNDKWVTKWDGAENTGIEPIKGGLSGAEKRAAVQWGVGRYLYDIDAIWAECITPQQYQDLTWEQKNEWNEAKKDKSTILYWKPKKLPAKFLPQLYINKTQVGAIERLISQTDAKVNLLLDYFGVDDVRDLYVNEADKIINKLTIEANKAKVQNEVNNKNKS